MFVEYGCENSQSLIGTNLKGTVLSKNLFLATVKTVFKFSNSFFEEKLSTIIISDGFKVWKDKSHKRRNRYLSTFLVRIIIETFGFVDICTMLRKFC
jgi:hypothetical protein